MMPTFLATTLFSWNSNAVTQSEHGLADHERLTPIRSDGERPTAVSPLPRPLHPGCSSEPGRWYPSQYGQRLAGKRNVARQQAWTTARANPYVAADVRRLVSCRLPPEREARSRRLATGFFVGRWLLRKLVNRVSSKCQPMAANRKAHLAVSPSDDW